MLIPLLESRANRLRGGIVAVLVFYVLAASVRHASAQVDQKPIALTQYRINEFAAAALTAEMSFSGVKGASTPGETPTQYALRVEGCVAALDRLAVQTEPLRNPPAVRDTTAENLARWQRIARAVRGLPSVARDLKQAWSVRQKNPTNHAFGLKLMEALSTVQAILNGLRDARP
jgi:galactokinase